MSTTGTTRRKTKKGDVKEEKAEKWRVVVAIVVLANQAYMAGNAVLQIIDDAKNNKNNGNSTIPVSLIHMFIVLAGSWILADFWSGAVHWCLDNYGTANSPLVGRQIAAVRHHHVKPLEVGYKNVFNLVSKSSIPFLFIPTILITCRNIIDPFTTLFWINFYFLVVMTTVCHKWSHRSRRKCPPIVNWLQDFGLIVSRKAHARHHHSASTSFEGAYCVLSGFCDPWLDRFGFWRRLEYFIYMLTGVESNAWKLDVKLRERTLRGDYGLAD